MALYVDSAFLNSIMEVVRTVPLAGVTTNPSILLAAQTQGQMPGPLEVLRELLARVEGHIFMQPGAMDEEEMYRQALSYDEESVISTFYNSTRKMKKFSSYNAAFSFVRKRGMIPLVM